LIIKAAQASSLMKINSELVFTNLPQGFVTTNTNSYWMPADSAPVDVRRMIRELYSFLGTDPKKFSHLEMAYVETECFGGYGSQWSFVMTGGKLVFGPFYHGPRGVREIEVDLPISDRPINKALRYLGVRKRGALDEFDALGLREFRSFST